MAKQSTEVALVDSTDYPVLDPASEASGMMAEVMAENFGDGGVQTFDLDRVTIPSGGGTTWEVPSLSGIDAVRELEGVIVAWETTRSYWVLALEDSEGGGTPPDCASPDGKVGFGEYGPGSDRNPTGQCEGCPMNEWASDARGTGKACKEAKQLFMLLPNRVLPVVVSLAPTSIAPLRKYFLRLAGSGIPYYGVTSVLSLEQQKGNGITYSTVTSKMGAALDSPTRAQAKEYGVNLRRSLGDRVRAEVSTPAEKAPLYDSQSDADQAAAQAAERSGR